jgi:L-threonylcarbamoyladenylate synthase
MPSSASNAAVDDAVAALRRGELIVYPTETLYGVGADATSAAALERLLALKVRTADKPTSVLVADRAMLDLIAADVPAIAERLLAKFWPGPLTLVLRARASVSPALTAGTGTIGVRVSSHPVAAAIVATLGRPLTAPSANPAGATPAVTVHEARAYFGGRIAVYVDGGTLPGGRGSTVVDVTGNPLRVLREGAVSSAALRATLAEAA